MLQYTENYHIASRIANKRVIIHQTQMAQVRDQKMRIILLKYYFFSKPILLYFQRRRILLAPV